MNKIILLLPLLTLAACSQEPQAAPAPTSSATPAPAATPALPAPDQKTFSDAFAAACPEAEDVNTAVCKRAAFGSEEVICEYGLGEDEYLRDKATLAPADGKWALKEPEAVCKSHLEHHAG